MPNSENRTMAVLSRLLSFDLCSCERVPRTLGFCPVCLFCPNPSHGQSVILQNKPNFQARPPAERRPRTYFHLSIDRISTSINSHTAPATQCVTLRNRCGAKRMILQNKANFPKFKTILISYIIRTYEIIVLPDNPKNKPNSNPIFELGIHPSADPAPASATASRDTVHGPLVTSHDFAKQTQFWENKK